MDFKEVQLNETKCQMIFFKNQYRTMNSSMVALYSKEKSPHTYHARASQESTFLFQQEKSCMSKRITIYKYRKRYKPYIFKRDSDMFRIKNSLDIMRKYSFPILRKKNYTTVSSKTKSSDDIILRKSNLYTNHNIVNVNSGAEHCYNFPNSFFGPTRSYKIYRCQFNIQEESCCCSCNSDAMFEVMKSLYDCYKKKNCDNCNCILCGHLPRQERRLGEERKSAVAITKVSEKKIKVKRKTKSKKVRDVSSLLKDKSPAEKEKILENLVASGAPLPEGKTKSEKELIKKVKAAQRLPVERVVKSKVPSHELMTEKALSEKLRKAKTEGLLTPLQGKSVDQKQKILKELAKNGIPLPEGKTASDKDLIDKVIKEMGLPPRPKTSSAKERYQKAVKAGLVTPLEGKSIPEKEKVLKGLADLGVELPLGRTASEKSLIAKVKASAPVPSEVGVKPEKVKTKVTGSIPILRGKTPKQKEDILKNLAMNNVLLPEGKTSSEKLLINKVRADVGLPPEPKSKIEKEIYKQAEAAGLIVPLEGKTQAEKEKILQAQADFGLPLPEGRTTSEKSLIKKIKQSEKKKVKSREKAAGSPVLSVERRKKLDAKTLKIMKEGKGPSDECICGLLAPEEERISRASKISPKDKIPSDKLKPTKTAGLLSPLEGKSPAQKEQILKDLAKRGIPLPEPKTASEKKILQKVQNDLGLPPIPHTASLKEKYAKAQAAGILIPLDGKTPSQKAKILKSQARMGLDLPVGRTASEKELINNIKTGIKPSDITSEKIRKISLEGKTAEEKEKIIRNLAKAGLPLPEGKTLSEKQLIKKVKEDVALQIKSPEVSEKLRKAKAAGLLTPLEGKTPAQKKEIMKRQLTAGLPLPELKSPSEKNFMKDVIAKTSKLLHGKTPSQKEKILRNIAKQGFPLPEPKTPSDKAIIEKVRAEVRPEIATPSAKLRQARLAGLLTPLEGKSEDQKEKILKGLIKADIPLPEAKSPSEKKIIEKVRQDFGLPPEPKTLSIKEKMKQAQAAGIITPLEGKTPFQKEKVLKKIQEAGIPLPKGRTSSEKAMIKKIKGEVPKEPSKGKVSSEKLREATAKGLLTPLEGKTQAQKDKILRGLAKSGLPLPEGKTPSEKALIHKIQVEEGVMPTRPSPLTRPSLPPDKLKKVDKRTARGIKESKGPSDECICDLLTPESEREKLSADKKPSPKILSEKHSKAKTAGLRTPLEGKTPEQKEKILKDMALHGVPLPEGKTVSEKKIIDKVRANIGLPPEPKTSSEKVKYKKAIAAGLITPLQGKSEEQKEKILRGQKDIGLKLPEPRTQSEKALIQKIKGPSLQGVTSDKIKKSKVPELVALEGKTPEQKEKILKDLAFKGIPLPEPKSSSEKKIINKVRAEIGLPPIPKTESEKKIYDKAKSEGLITPLHGKSAAQKEKILRRQAQMGLPLPEGRTTSEKALIAKIKAAPGVEVPKLAKSIEKVSRPAMPPEKIAKLDKKTAKFLKEGKGPSDECICGILTPESERMRVGVSPIIAPKEAEILKVPSKKIRKAKAAGLLTPLKGKTPEQKEKILKELAMQGIPLPEPKTASEKKLVDKVRNEVGLPPEPKTPSMKLIYNKAIADDVIVPLEGKSNAEKEKKLRNQAALGLPLPIGRTASEKAIIAKIKEAVPSEKLRKAKTAGLLTPLEGKTPENKEKILKGLVEAGLPLPEGKTPSEKALIQKVKTIAGVTPEVAISERGKIKTKSKKVGAPGVFRSVRGVTKSKGSIVEEFQDIIKTTTCDRGCGCDKKKIRFKHSYVKIRVTSPDISSLCPCPEECVPGVKGGLFTDNEGIKVTVGRVMCISSNSSRRMYQNENYSSTTFVPKLNIPLIDKNTNVNKFNNISKSESEIYLKDRFKKNQKFPHGNIPKEFYGKICKIDTSNLYLKNKSTTSLQYDYYSNLANSSESLYFLKTNSSLSLMTIPSIVSVWSFSTTSNSTNSTSDKQSFLKFYTNNYENLQSMLMFQDIDSKISNVSLDLYKYSLENQKSLLEIPIHRENNLDNEIQIYRANHVNKEIVDNHDKNVAYIDEISDKDEILKALNMILSKTQLKTLSSIIIIVPSSSDDCSTSNDSSTICVELSDQRSNWNPGTSGLHHVHQKQKGFKITNQRNLRHCIEKDSYHKLPKIYEIKKSYTSPLNQENNHYQPDSGCNKLNMISTDTTEDRPCCCNVVNDKNFENNKMTKHNAISQFVTPMILEELVAQGLINDSYTLDLPLANCLAKCSSRVRIHESNRCKTTPVRLCKIPSRSGHQSCHADALPNVKTVIQPHNIPNAKLYKSCECSPTTHKVILVKNTVQLISKGCGDSKEELRRKHVKLNHARNRTPYVITTQDSNLCSSSKSNLQSCISSDKNKQHLCPCEQHQKILNLDNYNNELNFKTEDTNLKNICQCKDQKRLKNIICECPEELKPEIGFDTNEWLDEAQLRKIQSDLTQTTSGFKIKIPKKKSDSELSFEEALKYFAENLENDKMNEEICDCNGKSKKAKNAKCECPYEPYNIPNEEETPPIEEPFTGIKFHIDGKGTASKGLSGILCFE